ncbi:hypothetical protein HB775_15175 [Rhizobium leguminosarum bv. trifolii]|nr:hypothetical protein HB775_15175 [Rhizobium leguminosarum bv. trifolii]
MATPGAVTDPSLKTTKARRDLSDSLLALWVFVFTHAIVAKPLHTFARHALMLNGGIASVALIIEA